MIIYAPNVYFIIHVIQKNSPAKIHYQCHALRDHNSHVPHILISYVEYSAANKIKVYFAR